MKATFEAADKSGDGLLSMDEVLKLLHKLNVNLSKRKVKQLFKVIEDILSYTLKGHVALDRASWSIKCV